MLDTKGPEYRIGTFREGRIELRDGDDFIFSFRLRNTGARDGEEVVQLYASFKGDDAAQRLRGFARVAVKAGETREVELVVLGDVERRVVVDALHVFCEYGQCG